MVNSKYKNVPGVFFKRFRFFSRFSQLIPGCDLAAVLDDFYRFRLISRHGRGRKIIF